MDRSRNIIITLIVIIIILIIALVGAMVYIFMGQSDNTKDDIVVNNANSNTTVDTNENETENEIENEIYVENDIQEDENTIVENENTNEIENPDDAANNNEDEENTTGDMDKLVFNTAFISYLGNITGEKLYTLLSTIEQSNIKYPEHQITLSSNNLQSLNEIVATDIYTITLSYDDNGYVSNIIIDKKLN